MSRSGYSYDLDNWSLIQWRGQVASSIRGKRGQKFLRDLLDALDAMPEKKLIRDELEDECGGVCAIGALGKARNIDMSEVDPYDTERLGVIFNISRQLAAEVVNENDEWRLVPEARWAHMREWVASHIMKEDANCDRSPI